MYSKKYAAAYHATNLRAKSRGVSILVAGDLPFRVLDSKIDADGRYIFLKGLIGTRTVTLANIYAPNTKHCPFFSEVCDYLTLFREGLTIMGGRLQCAIKPPYRHIVRIHVGPLQGAEKDKGDSDIHGPT